MKSRVELDIEGRPAEVAELFADPRNNPRWMDDLDRVEPISGELGQQGSVYRMVPASGTMVFDATVVRRALPGELRLLLRARQASVLITDTFLKLSEHRTKLISVEVFTFHGLLQRVLGMFARSSIRHAHRRHMESFKRFAESRSAA